MFKECLKPALQICGIFVILDLSTPAIGTGIQSDAIGILVWMWNGLQGLLLLGKSCARKVHPQFQRYDILLKYDAVLRPLMGVHSRIDCRCCPKIMAADTLPIGIPLGGR